jgi:hypothetical protein
MHLGTLMHDIDKHDKFRQHLVFLPGFQAVLAKKGQFVSYKEKLEKWTEFHYF